MDISRVSPCIKINMPRITGTIADSTGTPLDGTLSFTANQAFGLEGTEYLPVTHDFIISSGAVDVTVPSSSYNVKFTGQDLVVYWDINTTFNDQDTTIDQLAGLVVEDRYNSTLIRVAQILANQYGDQLSPQLVSRGEWNSITLYNRNDLVSFNGSSYLFTSSTPASGIPVTDDSIWALLAQKGDTGTGTTGVDTPYDISWDGDINAATKNALYDILETLAPIDSPTFTGDATAPVFFDIADASAKIATTAWVQDWRINGPGIKSLTSQTMRVEAGPYSFKLAWGFYTTPVVTWVAGNEQTFDIILPDSFTIDNQRAIVATIKGVTGTDGIFQLRAEPGLTNDRFTVGLQIELDNNYTSAITISWFMAGA